MSWHIVGILAASLTTFSFLPQVIRMKQTKSVNDVSIAMLVQLSLGVFLWIVYGIYLKNFVIIIANLITLCLISSGIYFYLRYKK